MDEILLALILGYVLDLLIGDPHWMYHPIRLVGNLISFLEKTLRCVFPKTERAELTAGMFLVIFTTGITAPDAARIKYLVSLIHPEV